MRCLCLVLVAAFALPASVRADDPCAALLADGVYEAYASSASALSQGSFHSAMCNSTIIAGSSNESRDASLNIGIGKINLGLSTDEARQFQSLYRNAFCSTQQVLQLNSSQVTEFRKVASSDVINGYNQCVKLRDKGLQAEIEVTPDRRVVTVSFTFISQNSTPQPKFTDISVEPNSASASCTLYNIEKGALIDNTQHQIICRRERNDAVLISIITQYGKISKYLPNEAEREVEILAARLAALEGRVSAVSSQADSANRRLDGLRLTSTGAVGGTAFGCGGQDIAPAGLQVMVGSRDGTSCGVPNVNYYTTLGISVPPQ